MTGLVFLSLMLVGVPIVYVLLSSAFFYIEISDNRILFDSIPQQIFSGIEAYGLLAIPLFMLTGELMSASGVTKRLMGVASLLVGGFRGGLAYVNLLANMMMASIMGSAVAQIAMMSKVVVPEMEKQGYSRPFASALTAASGLLSPIIPPSMLFVVFGVLAQIPIGDMFIAGIIPGLILGLMFIGVITYLGIKHNFPAEKRKGLSEMKKDVVESLPAMCIPGIIISSILFGLATPTESAGIAALISFIIGKYIYKTILFKDIGKLFFNTAIGSGTVLALIAAAHVFGWALIFEQIPQTIALWVGDVTDDPFIFMLLVNVLLLLVGMVLDGIAALILVVPLLLPIAIIDFNISPVQFGVITCINLVLGLLTPPVGAGLYIASSMSNVHSNAIFRSLFPFLLCCLGLLVLLSYFPALTTGLIQ
ncbi:C4-dicarboxylate ABC transporter permease (plasmid) [Vibrio nigripulchritudo]|uniref:TRAP transporter large permease n=1 Tax=Vibrio nigripulchritudo TaxID=28173 RepID=UPI00190DA715|nr:TRAP transporter large permease [Vibrio nigripulchritudo]BCL73728.1 C4-dicarboxylate ABC transporter permease [Vibrio nigripulchritudo]BDU35103.1 C4-dicarboxylate ABC transporter permease [Vibrio nigripulchritudo]